MKYIIEIEDKPLVRDGEKLWRASAFKSLVFDQDGLRRLIPYHEPGKEEMFQVGDEEVKRFAALAAEALCKVKGMRR